MISVLLVGYGRRGRHWHGILRKRRREFRVAGIVDPDPKALGAAAALGIPGWAQLDEALGSGANAAIVASPPEDHVAQAVACLRAGVGVLVEKPLHRGVAGAAALLEEAARTSLPAMVGQNQRYFRREQVLRKLLDRGVIGDVRTMVMVTGGYTPYRGAPLDVVLWDTCVHYLDALRNRAGSVPERVTAAASEHAPGGLAGSFAVSLRWSGLPDADFFFRRADHHHHHHEWIEGTSGDLTVERQRTHIVRPGRYSRRVYFPWRLTSEMPLLDALRRWIEGEPSPHLGVADNMWTLATVEAAVRSLATGKAVVPADVVRESGIDQGLLPLPGP